jgi:hypothetical protein
MGERDALYKAAGELSLELRRGTLPPSFRPRRIRVAEAGTGGWYAILARHLGSIRVAVFFYKYVKGHQRHFWYGFWADDVGEIDTIENAVPAQLKPLRTFTDLDLTLRRGIWHLSVRPSDSDLRYPLRDNYAADGEYYFGMHDLGGHASKDRLVLDAPRAAQFIRLVVELWSRRL